MRLRGPFSLSEPVVFALARGLGPTRAEASFGEVFKGDLRFTPTGVIQEASEGQSFGNPLLLLPHLRRDPLLRPAALGEQPRHLLVVPGVGAFAALRVPLVDLRQAGHKLLLQPAVVKLKTARAQRRPGSAPVLNACTPRWRFRPATSLSSPAPARRRGRRDPVRSGRASSGARASSGHTTLKSTGSLSHSRSTALRSSFCSCNCSFSFSNCFSWTDSASVMPATVKRWRIS